MLTLWVAVVAEREGYTFEEGLSFGRFIAALFARTKGQRLGIFEKEVEAEASKAQKLVAPKGKRRVEQVERFEVFGMRIPGIRTETGLRLAVWGGKPIHPNVVKAYLLRAFGSDFDHVKGECFSMEPCMLICCKSFLTRYVTVKTYSLDADCWWG